MNQHLSSEQISKWIAGERTPQEEEHSRECPRCRAELLEMENTLSGFRCSFEQVNVPGFRIARKSEPFPALRWALAGATLLVLAMVPIYKNAKDQERAKEDDLLLQRVNASLSRSVPASMEPLMRLMSSNGKEQQ